MRTHIVKPNEINRKWYVVDAQGQTLGRLATEIAHVLRGKHKAAFSPHLDNGDFVIVINAEKVAVAPRNISDKFYTRYSGYPGGLRRVSLGDMIKNHPERVITNAVKGMIPHNVLGRQQIRKLKVYVGPDHPHEAQQPLPFEFFLR
jgi:large subunit ribosomal protein L13